RGAAQKEKTIQSMIGNSQSPALLVRVVRAIGLLVPTQFRGEWRREWGAELIHRWLLLDRWGRVNAPDQFDLWQRVAGAFADVLWFQRARTRLLLVILNMAMAGLTAFGAGQ